MTIEQIDRELAELAGKVRPITARMADLWRDRRRLCAAEFIRANNVTRDQIEMSSGDDRPWFGRATEFGRWMREQGTSKRFCEWNGRVYFSADVMAGRLPDAPAAVSDVPA